MSSKADQATPAMARRSVAATPLSGQKEMAGDGWSGRRPTRASQSIGEEVVLDADRNGARGRRPTVSDDRMPRAVAQAR